MSDVIIYVALDDGGGKWEQGTIIECHPRSHASRLEWGDVAHFLVLDATTDDEGLLQQRVDARSHKIDLSMIMPAEDIAGYVANLGLAPGSFATHGKARPTQVIDLDLPGVVVARI